MVTLGNFLGKDLGKKMARRTRTLPPGARNLAVVVGENLRRLIEDSSCGTQEEFAFRFGTDVRTVGRWCNKGVNSLITIQQIAIFFDVDALSLFEEHK